MYNFSCKELAGSRQRAAEEGSRGSEGNLKAQAGVVRACFWGSSFAPKYFLREDREIKKIMYVPRNRQKKIVLRELE